MLDLLISIQRSIQSAISADIAAFSTNRDWLALLAVLPLGIVFGAVHALTPGHSKIMLAGYVAGSGLSTRKVLLTAVTLSGTHIGMAILLALVGSTLVTRTVVGAGQAPTLEWLSRLLLVGIGLWLLARSLSAHNHPHVEGAAFGIFAGLIPCPLTLFVMVYALSRGVPEAGVTFAFAMLLGVGFILVTVALLSRLAGNALQATMSRHGQVLACASQLLSAASGIGLIVLAGLDLAR